MKRIIIKLGAVLILCALGFYLFQVNEERKLNDYRANLNNDKKEIIVESIESKNPNTVVKTYTWAEVATHNTKSNCWLVINGNVLDVTSFISLHPGGDKILKGCGLDATSYFNKVSGHMKGMAQTLLTKLKIGEIKN